MNSDSQKAVDRLLKAIDEIQAIYTSFEKFHAAEKWGELEAAKLAVRSESSGPDGDAKPVAWLVPKLIDLKADGARVLGDPTGEKAVWIDGSVSWTPTIFCDTQDRGVTDKHGVTHFPKPLYTQPKQHPIPQRYDIYATEMWGEAALLEKDHAVDGEWVRWEDIAALYATSSPEGADRG